MNFEEWYEANKEPLTQLTLEAKLKLAFNAGDKEAYEEGMAFERAAHESLKRTYKAVYDKGRYEGEMGE